MTAPVCREGAAGSRPRTTTSGRHLKWVQYLPAGGDPVVCAAIWREGDHVHLVSPFLPSRHGARDSQGHEPQFPHGAMSIEAFDAAMTCLDAACYAATDPRQIKSACEEHPEWQLRCIRADGSDAALPGLQGLFRAAGNVGLLPASAMRDYLMELIDQILKNDPELVGARIKATFRDGDDVATLDIGTDCPVLVALLVNVESTDAVRQGLLAHQRMTEHEKSRLRCLLVIPDLQIGQPMFMTPRVAITNMEPDHIHAALVQMGRG